MHVLYIASNFSRAGKTALAVSLAQRLRHEGKKATVFKPLNLSNHSNGVDPDVKVYQRFLGQGPGDWPIATSGEQLSKKDTVDGVIQVFQGLPSDQDLVIVEGISGLDVPASKEIAEALDAKVVIVGGYTADLAIEQLVQAKSLFGERLIGVVINGLTRYMGVRTRVSTVPMIESQGLKVFGVIPEDRRLLGITVGQIAEHLNGRFLVGEKGSDGLVERLLIGGMTLDSGVLYFGQYDNKAVIVRADRPDVQMAALQTPTTCLILTGGKQPVEYVLYEAGQEGVPVILVDADTHATAVALESLMEKANFDHPLKLQRFQELLEKHVELQALYQEFGL